MSSIYVCPHCGSRKIRKEFEGDEDYCCDVCLEFFPEPKILNDEKSNPVFENKGFVNMVCRTDKLKNEEGSKMDKEKLKLLHAEGKSDKEIGEALNEKTGTVWAARTSLGLKNNYTLKKSPKRSIDRPIPPPTKK